MYRIIINCVKQTKRNIHVMKYPFYNFMLNILVNFYIQIIKMNTNYIRMRMYVY